jgi:hypothetical protein
MLSGKLIRLIETHHKQIGDRILRDIGRQPNLQHLRGLPDAELRERGQKILEHLGDWLAADAEEIWKREEELGKLRFEQSIPLSESIHALCIVKNNVIDFIEEQGIPRDPLGLYAQEEMEHRLGQFFDRMIIHLARGYETAWHIASLAAA